MHQHVQQKIIVFKKLKHKLISVVMLHAQPLLNNLKFMLDKIFMLDNRLSKQVLNNGKLVMQLLLLQEMESTKHWNQLNKIDNKDKLFTQWMLMLLLVMLNFLFKEIFKIQLQQEDSD